MGDKKPSLSDVLFPKVRQAVLRLLFGQPDTQFHTNQIIRLTHSGTGAVQRELDRLAEVGLITVESKGNRKQYQANKSSPLYAEIKSIVVKTFGLVDILREALQQIENEIDLAFVYGSIAKNEDTSSSDIDLMIISDTLSYAEIFPLLEKTREQVGREINPTFYSKSEWKKKLSDKKHFIMQVMKQPKLFLYGTEDELKQLR